MTGDEMLYAYAPDAPVTIRVADALRAVQACSAAARPQYINPRAAEAYLDTLARIVESIEDESRRTPAVDNTPVGDMLTALESVEECWTRLHGVDAFVRDWPEVQRVLTRYRDDYVDAPPEYQWIRVPLTEHHEVVADRKRLQAEVERLTAELERVTSTLRYDDLTEAYNAGRRDAAAEPEEGTP